MKFPAATELIKAETTESPSEWFVSTFNKNVWQERKQEGLTIGE